MRNSRVFAVRLAAFALPMAAALAGCGTYGDPCLRTTDCGSGFVCVEGKCLVDLGDNPPDATIIGDAPVSSDAPSTRDAAPPDASRDASIDAISEEGSAPPADAADSDATRDAVRDGPADGDGPEMSSFDASRDADVGAPFDAVDARAATDTGSGNGDAIGGDVGRDADSGSVMDATVDAPDAAG